MLTLCGLVVVVSVVADAIVVSDSLVMGTVLSETVESVFRKLRTASPEDTYGENFGFFCCF